MQAETNLRRSPLYSIAATKLGNHVTALITAFALASSGWASAETSIPFREALAEANIWDKQNEKNIDFGIPEVHVPVKGELSQSFPTKSGETYSMNPA